MDLNRRWFLKGEFFKPEEGLTRKGAKTEIRTPHWDYDIIYENHLFWANPDLIDYDSVICLEWVGPQNIDAYKKADLTYKNIEWLLLSANNHRIYNVDVFRLGQVFRDPVNYGLPLAMILWLRRSWCAILSTRRELMRRIWLLGVTWFVLSNFIPECSRFLSFDKSNVLNNLSADAIKNIEKINPFTMNLAITNCISAQKMYYLSKLKKSETGRAKKITSCWWAFHVSIEDFLQWSEKERLDFLRDSLYPIRAIVWKESSFWEITEFDIRDNNYKRVIEDPALKELYS